MDFGFRWDTTYKTLPSFFYQDARPLPMPAPRGVVFNADLARDLSLNATALQSTEGAHFLAGHHREQTVAPLAQAYAGHQFGRFTMLGDGRALLYGEHVTPDGRRVDIHLKGTGPTPYSRRGDGRAAMGPMLREYVISEAMHALGIPTTRSLAVIGTGEEVFRQTIHPGALLVRVAKSHLRVGTFEYAAAFYPGSEMVRALVEFTIKRHHADLLDLQRPEDRYVELARRVTSAQIKLITEWMRVGFIHGVMNTDNMAISGETIDYGPCAFMDRYDPMTVFSSIDQHGRYAFARQPEIAQWNLARFLETLLPLLDHREDVAIDIANTIVRDIPNVFRASWLQMMRSKLGWSEAHADDADTVQKLCDFMHDRRLDYTNTFLSMTRALDPDFTSQAMDLDLGPWGEAWRCRVASQTGGASFALTQMRRVNPVFIPRNHLVEAALAAAEIDGDLSQIERMLAVLRHPYQEQSGQGLFESIPDETDQPYKTFCGT